MLNNPKKINRNVVDVESVQVKTIEGKTIIIIPINKVDYKDKPIYLNENITSTYFRQGTGDYRCSQEQINTMLRDSAKESFDGTLIQNFSILDLDEETINRYREKFNNINTEHPFSKLNTEQFLLKINALRKDRKDNKVKPTVAGLLIFGKHTAIKEFIPHYNVEYVLKEFNKNNRFKDRVIYDGTWGEDNLFNFFYLVIEKLYLTLNDTSNLQENSVNRIGISKLRIAIREAFVNSLIHCDYKSDKGIVIIRYSDRYIFTNGGTLRIDLKDFFTGAHSDPRNYLIQEIFRFLNLCEKAGTGVPKIMEAVKESHLKYPKLDTQLDSVELTLWDTSLIDNLNIDNEFEKKILELIIENHFITRETLEEKLKIHKNTILKYLKILLEKHIIDKFKSGRQYVYFIAQNQDPEFQKYNHINTMYSLLEEIKRK
ncbi:BlaI/MecI/CopY family transcriptional regulator [Streptococcus didelphis]|uniref:BlaI/MecI/CopY family transcriptional regulator n=1 Tax=Streptococcus didelphis TaxID=102886 RepID=A0ABY9LG86_9STRE|nr:ATP-binding protein [Streptococcus didelphis]WMB27893.1 BlaI/MecI/CopY family transcriptional regulator [Streptococcus didelphis]